MLIDSAFKLKGMWAPKKLKKNSSCHKVFLQFGEEWDITSHVLEQLEEFTCLVYGQNRESSIDGLRAKPLRKIVGEPLCFEATLPVGEPPRSLI